MADAKFRSIGPGATPIGSGLEISLDGTLSAVGGGVLVATVPLSSAQILNSVDTPVTIVPAAGAGTVVIIDKTVYAYNAGTTGYSGGGNDHGLYYGSASLSTNSADSGDQNVCSGDTSQVALTQGSFNSGLNDDSVVNNVAVIYSGLTPYTLGNGTLKITVEYFIAPVT